MSITTKKYVDSVAVDTAVSGITVDNIGQIIDTSSTLSVSGVSGISVSSNTYVNLNGYSHTTLNISSIGLTAEEMRELDALKLEKKEILKQEKINKFRQFPQHIRQKIVDDIQLSRLVTELANTELTIENTVQKRILELLQRDNRVQLSGIDSFYHYSQSPTDELKQHLSEEEILDIHSSISLEEAISTSTDSIKKYE